MPNKLPADFNSVWYAATYRDVALSGLTPHDHYLRFGKALGRPSRPSKTPSLGKDASAQAPAQRDQPAVPRDTAAPKNDVQSFPIIQRPAGFDPADSSPQPAPPRDSGLNGVFGLETIIARSGTAADNAALTSALHSYAQLMRLPLPAALGEPHRAPSCAAGSFQAGATRLENFWLAEPTRLRLMLGSNSNAETEPSRWALRAYQADGRAHAALHVLGSGVELPPIGPVIHDVELLHPMMPLLLELCDGEGVSHGFTLVPFPSLLPGGLHAAELKALQAEPNPMDAFWSLSEVLLQEIVGRDGVADKAVTRVTIDGEGLEGEPLSSDAVREWLAAVFDLEPTDAGAHFQSGSAQAGLELLLPRGSVPTISALVSRRLSVGDSAFMSGPYLIADDDSNRPRWSIALPAGVDADGAVPTLRPTDAAGDLLPSTDVAPIHLAIALRSADAVGGKTPPAIDGVLTTKSRALSVLVKVTDGVGIEALIAAVRATSEEAEYLFVLPEPTEEFRALLDNLLGEGGWTQVADGSDLPMIARSVRYPILLTVSDRIELINPGTLPALLDMLDHDERAASASCALQWEKIIKRQVVLQPGSGGLFPTGVSFASGPRLSFGEPDVLEALSGLTYPVVANESLLTAWRTSALAELPAARGPVSASGEDVRIGLDLMDEGYRNWCTTQVIARLSGPYVRRDMIDPVGAAYMQARRWEDILGRVTVVRELF
jgi:hypothetical protein